MQTPRRRYTLAVALAAVYALAVLVPFRVFLPRFSTHLIGDHGDALLQHLHCAWQWLALAEGRFSDLLVLPTMHPYSSGFVFGETLLGVTLPLAPIHLLGASTAATFNTAVMLSFLLLGVAVFAWVRDFFDSTAAGLFAAVLIVFTPWRLHYLSNLNNLTVYYAVFGMWMLSRWLRRPAFGTLLAAALLFHVQLLTTAQVALAAIYLSCIWLLCVWIASPGPRFDRRRIIQGLAASAVFLALGLPWLGFFQEAFDATPGLLRTEEMKSYSSPFLVMAWFAGALGPLGASAAAGALALALGARRGLVSRARVVSLVGFAAGAATLFVIARGPYVGPESDPIALPGYYAVRWLPLLDAVRAPIRLAAMTPILLALLAGGGFALLERVTTQRLPARWRNAFLLLPLALIPWWPALPPAMASPISQRPADHRLASALAELPASSVFLSLPMDPEPSGAAVDERVLVHRRAQIAGFASIYAEPFRQARLQLGQWPQTGTEAAQALGATHLIVPVRWLDRHARTISSKGYEVVDTVGTHAIVSVPPAREALPSFELEVPRIAAVDRWLTLSLSPAHPIFQARGHRAVRARWSGPGGVHEVTAHAFLPGIAGPDQPIRIHVPTPTSTGRHELHIEDPLGPDSPRGPIEATVDLGHYRTSLQSALEGISITPLTSPGSVRPGEPFLVRVEVEVRASAPILLATSRCSLPERCGEVELVYQYRRGRAVRGGATAPARTTLTRDLVPGDSHAQTWVLRALPREGRYSVFARLEARGSHGQGSRMAWTELISNLTIRHD